ncbi:MAG: helix-turn-helix transcriptional regulator [Muribaculaceae bacterium]|nr:helix-turn-helix transcriptional regulator [Muribaculaceae bacterium]
MARYDLPKLRKTLNMTQKELARLLNVTQGFLSSVENGRNPFPDDRVDDLQSVFPDVDLSDYEVSNPAVQTTIGSGNSQSDITVNDPATLKAMMQIIRETNKDEQQVVEGASSRLFEMQDRIMALTDELEKTRKEKYELKDEIFRLQDLLRENGIDYTKKSATQ